MVSQGCVGHWCQPCAQQSAVSCDLRIDVDCLGPMCLTVSKAIWGNGVLTGDVSGQLKAVHETYCMSVCPLTIHCPP